MLRLFGLVVLSISHMTSAALAAWPDRPITIIVPFAAGGATDVVSRVMADYMRKTLGQPVLVENFGGAGGTIGTGRVANAPADGYTLLMGSLGTQVASVGLYPKLRYDPKKDFAPVIKVVATPMVVSVRKDLPVKDFREFLVYLKQNSSKLNFASGGVGAQSHLLCLYLSYLTNTTPTHVSYRGSGPAMNALMAQDVDFSCDQALGVMPYVGSGIIKPLAVAREKRFAMTPDIPTASEEGLPEFKGDGWLALFAPRDNACGSCGKD